MLVLFLILGFILGIFAQRKIANRSFARSLEKRKLSDSDNEVTQFATQIYHDLQSPLSALCFLVKSAENADENTKAHLTVIIQHLQDLSSLLWVRFSENKNTRSHFKTSSGPILNDEAPGWMIDKIQFALPCHFVILDDQPFAHEQWERTLKTSITPEQERQIIRHHMNSHSEFMQWYQDHDYGSLENVLYLFDMDLGVDAPESGLDLIDRLSLQKRAILVTNQAADPRVQNLCAKRKIHLLAKAEISQIPLIFTKNNSIDVFLT